MASQQAEFGIASRQRATIGTAGSRAAATAAIVAIQDGSALCQTD